MAALLVLALTACRVGLADGALLAPLSELRGSPRIPYSGEFGRSVSISADGRTALVGSPGKGAWIFDRVGSEWIQDGPPLGGAEATQEGFGCSVALSADGDVALVGAPGPAGLSGAAWVFTRGSAGWQGVKLSPGEATAPSRDVLCEPYYGGSFGTAVALSADGRTALVGATRDGVLSTRNAEPERGGHVGGVWVFARSGEAWTQQGARLSPDDEVGEGEFGAALALSADGDTALIGAPRDAHLHPADATPSGAAWVFARSDGIWTQRGGKLAPKDSGYGAMFGASVALSAAADTALIGGPYADLRGAVWPSFATAPAGRLRARESPQANSSTPAASGRAWRSPATVTPPWSAVSDRAAI